MPPRVIYIKHGKHFLQNSFPNIPVVQGEINKQNKSQCTLEKAWRNATMNKFKQKGTLCVIYTKFQKLKISIIKCYRRARGTTFTDFFPASVAFSSREDSDVYTKKKSTFFVMLKKMVGEIKNNKKQLFPVLAPRVLVQSYCPLPIYSEKAP